MADDAGALLVRSGLVSSNALDDARARVANVGGTLGEQLVTNGAITDDALTDFYRSRLLVPQINPNMLARLTPSIVGMLPGDMAIELRAIPVSLDGDNNLTVAMSDPSDRHAVDEIAFFTGAYVVRAVATQMQIAWCLAHYYGHVTALGQRLLHTTERDAASKAAAASSQRPRTKGLTGKVNAARHRAVAPITGPVNVIRPNSGELDLRPLAGAAVVDPSPGAPPHAPAVVPVAPPGQPAILGGSGAAPHDAIPDPGARAALPTGRPRSAPIADLAARADAPADPGHARAGVLAAASPTVPGTARAGVSSAAPPVVPSPAPAAPRAGVSSATPSAAAASPRDPRASGSSSATPLAPAAGLPLPPAGGSGAPRAGVPSGAPPVAAGGPRDSLDRAASGTPAKTIPHVGAPAAGRSGASDVGVSNAGANLAGSTSAGHPAPANLAATVVGAPTSTLVGVPAGPTGGAGRGSPTPPGLSGAPAGHSSPMEPGPTARAQAPGRPAATPPGLSSGPGRTDDTPAPSVTVSADPAHLGPASDAPPQRSMAVSPGSPSASGARSAASSGTIPRAAPDAPTLPPRNVEAFSIGSPPDMVGEIGSSDDGAPDKPRARSVSGEIRVPVRRAPSIRPPLPDADDDDDEPLIVIEEASDDDATGPRMLPPRRRAVKSDPPELYARAGEVDLKSTSDRTIADEPRIVVDEDAFAPTTARIDLRGVGPDDPPLTTIDVVDDADTGALIHDRVVEREPDRESQPILLDRPRATPDPLRPDGARSPAPDAPPDDDTGETDVVVLEARKRPRPDRRTQVGVPPAPVAAPHPPVAVPQPQVAVHPPHDTETSGVPTLVDGDLERTGESDDPTMLDLRAAPPGEETTSDQLAAPPGPASEYDTNPYVIAPPPQPAPPRPSAIQPAMIVQEDEEDEDVDEDTGESRGPRTSEMTAAELDDAVPERTTELDLSQLPRRRIEYDPVDDGWGPPGTTIPPPLLGAIPGSEDDDDDEAISTIPMPSVDSSPLMVGPPTLPPTSDAGGQSLVRTLEDATARAIEVIHEVEHAESRDEVVDVLVAYLAETHHRAGFFVTRHGSAKGATELSVFAMMPQPAVMPFATLRLDRPSTLQDVVGTRLPYRGPMHDDTSRAFLISVLGACPAEILLVPVAVRERVVGVLFGEHRQRHTFDDQLALAARAAGMALERILRAKRS